MRKILIYCSFVIASLMVIFVFVTATTYTQLIIAIVLYPPLVYFAFRVFPRKSWQVNPKEQVAAVQLESENAADNVVDTDKRTFLKLIGVTGFSLFLYSIFTRRAQLPFLGGSTSESESVSLQDTAGNIIDPAEKQPTDGYRITEFDDSIIAYYGFTHKNGSWFIMKEDTDTGSFRYVRGDSNFTNGWAGREDFKYDYFINVF